MTMCNVDTIPVTQEEDEAFGLIDTTPLQVNQNTPVMSPREQEIRMKLIYALGYLDHYATTEELIERVAEMRWELSSR